MKKISEGDAISELIRFSNDRAILRCMLDLFKDGQFKDLDNVLEIDVNADNLMIRRKLGLLKYSIDAKVGVDVNIKNAQGMTPMHIAASIGYHELIKLLGENDADIEAKDQHGRTPMHLAAAKGYTETTKCLVDIGANINARDKYKNAPVHYAACKGKLESVICLIESGASCNFTLKTRPEKSILNYLEFGAFLQSLCSAKPYLLAPEREKNIECLLRQDADMNPLIKFARLTMKNYTLKVGGSSSCLQKIKNCSILPEIFKTSLTQTIEPLFKTVDESLKASGWQPLFTNEQLDHIDVYCYEGEEITIWEKNQGELTFLGDLNQWND